MGIPAIRQSLFGLTSGVQPRPLPTMLGVENTVMAPGVEVVPLFSEGNVGSFELRSRIGLVNTAPGVVTVREPSRHVSTEARRLMCQEAGWALGGCTLSGKWQIQPPLAFRRDSGCDPSADSIRESTVTALAALARLMPPGLETTRHVVINEAGISDERVGVMLDAIRMCDGLGLGEVTLQARNHTEPIGTTVPIFIGAQLLTDELAQQVVLPHVILDYMIAVMTHGGAGPFDFHLVVGPRAYDLVVEDARGEMRSEADRAAHSFLELMALDPRLVSGAGVGSSVSFAAGATFLFGGILTLAQQSGDIGLWGLVSALLGGAWIAGSAGVRARWNAKSVARPAIATCFDLTTWPSPSAEPSAHRLSRLAGGRGSAMYTQVT